MVTPLSIHFLVNAPKKHQVTDQVLKTEVLDTHMGDEDEIPGLTRGLRSIKTQDPRHVY